MHRYHKYAATALWPISLSLFVAAMFEGSPVVRYSIYAVGVWTALAAATFTILAALESVVARSFKREAALSREALAGATAKALADELEQRKDTPSLYMMR